MRTAFLIDGTAFCYRAFYAIRVLSTQEGRPTNAVYGFARMLQALAAQHHPDYLAVGFDVGKPTFRHREFKDYKSQRKPMPEALISQLPLVKRLLEASRIPVFEQEGYEAEDVLATIASQIVKAGVEVFFVTGDKDMLQLVNSHIKVLNPHHEDAVLDAEAVQARYGVGPEQMVDLMALMGDAIDNIPNVPGIGEKTATQLVQQFGSVENLYRHLKEVENPAQRESLQRARAQVEQARELARVRTDVPVRVTLENLARQEPDWRLLRALYRELEFKKLLETLEDRAPAAPAATRTLHALKDARDVEAWRHAAERGMAAVGCWPVAEGRVALALAVDAAAAWADVLDAAWFKTTAGTRLGEWLRDPQAGKLGHDVKAAMRALQPLEVNLQGVRGDTMLAAYLLNPARTRQSLSDLADEHLGAPLGPVPAGEELDGLQAADARQACGRSVCAILALHERLTATLDETGVTALYQELELPLLSVLAQMEATGVAVDVPHLHSLRASMEATLAGLVEEITALAGTTFNLNSPKQLAQVLFERLTLPVIKRTKTGPSTDSDVLQQLAQQHPLPQRLLQYRELAKLVSTYVEALPKLVNPRTGRLHTSFNQAATSTGRLSSSEPNLQNIPIKTELGRSIRRAFIAGIPDGVLLAADYSQIELRILAHLSGDERLAEAFRQGHDIHRFTASLIYGIPEAQVEPPQRSAMKAVNFGILYGMSAHGLSKELGLPHEEAQAFIDAYFQRYPEVRAYLESQIAHAKRAGFVQTMLGRRRYIPEVHSPDPVIRQLGERMAINAPIQGTAADLIKRAMVTLARRLPEETRDSRLVLQVHDELVFEAPRRELTPLARLVKTTMEEAIALSVPLVVTLKTGPNWLDLNEVQVSALQ